jgi:hypothetical protein
MGDDKKHNNASEGGRDRGSGIRGQRSGSSRGLEIGDWRVKSPISIAVYKSVGLGTSVFSSS